MYIIWLDYVKNIYASCLAVRNIMGQVGAAIWELKSEYEYQQLLST